MATTDRNWDEARVTDATAANSIDTEINYVRGDVRERMAIDHDWDSSDTGASDLGTIGQHEQITFKAPRATPDLDANQGMVYTKDANSKAELHYCDEDDQELQITTAGAFNLAGNIPADAIDQDDIRLENNASLTGRNNADDGDIEIVKVNTSDGITVGAVTTLPDTSALATSGAPAADAQIANKKYVDDNIGAANYTPTSYAGEESITFPNGLVMKTGSDTEGAVSFGAAFSTAIVSVVGTIRDDGTTAVSDESVRMKSVSVSGFTITVIGSAGKTVDWIAIGY